MKLSRFILLCLCISFCVSETYAQKTELVTIPNSQHVLMHSKIAAHDYDIYIHYPAGYDTAKKKFPVLYVVDGDNDFSPSLEYLGLMMAEYHIQEPILVAIGDGGLIGSPGNKRNRDFTPTATKNSPESGGAADFLGFIEKELMPMIDSKYKSDPANRTLYGYSMGGLFGSYVLFTKPALFKNILIGSPALGYDNGRYLTLKKNTLLPTPNCLCMFF